MGGGVRREGGWVGEVEVVRCGGGGEWGGDGVVVGGLGFCRRRFGHENKLFGRNKIEG